MTRHCCNTAKGGKTKRIFPSAVVLALMSVALTGKPASALIINLTFDATIAANFGSNAAAFIAAATTAKGNFTSLYSDAINVNIAMTSVTGTSILGQSSTPIFSLTYASLRGAAVTDAKSTDDFTSIGAGGSVRAADPNPGGNWWVTRAQRKALGLAVDDLTTDGTVTLGSGFTYDYDRSNGITAGQIDIVGVMMHEFSEVMGRIGISGQVITTGPGETLLDNFSYTGAGVKGLGNGAGNYFSIDHGTTNLKAFNDAVGLGGDSRDWASGANDSFNAFSSSGVLNGLTPVGIQTMDVIGYDLITGGGGSAPEPSSGVFLVSALVVGGLLRRSRRTVAE